MVYVRITVLMGYIIYFTAPLGTMFEAFLVSSSTLSTLTYPVWYLFWCLKTFLILVFELIYPLWGMASLILGLGWSLITTILALPFNLVALICTFLYDGMLSFALFFKAISASVQGAMTFFRPVVKEENREATLTML